MSEDGRDCRPFDTFPPSAKFVYAVLEYPGDLTRRELAEEARPPDRTSTDARSTPRERGPLDHRPLATQPGARRYHLDAPSILG